MTLTIRPAEERDLARLTEIYNHYVESTAITFDIDPYDVEARRPWFRQFGIEGRFRLFVAERAGLIDAYAGTTSFRPKRAYDTTVEATVYCAPNATGLGLGRELFSVLWKSLEGEDVHSAVAGITLPNEPSIKLHERFGFELSGVLHDVGRKLGRYWDVAWYEKRLGASE
jgi:phosphinothricin acetyltransferase